MKRCFTIGALCLLLSFSCVNLVFSQNTELPEKILRKASNPYKNKVAIIIGNYNYFNSWSRLPEIENEINKLDTLLKSIGFSVPFRIHNASKEQLDNIFNKNLQKWVNENDGLLIYFAGHGKTVSSKKTSAIEYIIPVNADTLSTKKYFSLTDLKVILDQIKVKHKICIFNTNLTGKSILNSDTSTRDIDGENPVTQFIFAGDAAYENEKNHNTFAQVFMNSISAASNTNNDSFLTGSEIFKSCKDSLIKRNLGHPYWGILENPAIGHGDFRISEVSPPMGEIQLITEIKGYLRINSEQQIEVSETNVPIVFLRKPGKYEMSFESFNSKTDQKTIQLAPNSIVSYKIKTSLDGQISSKSFDYQVVFVKGGSFRQGNDTDPSKTGEAPKHEVILDDFYIGKFEVTQAQWKAIMGRANPRIHNQGCPDCPVENVSFDTVEMFISRLNKLTNENYRLPTEAEWEFCARGGIKSKTDFKYSGSNNLQQVAWYGENETTGNTHPVGQKLPNALDIHDMNGNVSEWCSDWYSLTYYSQSTLKNPKGPNGKELKAKVVRGGSWKDKANDISVSARYRERVNVFNNTIGFRLVLVK